MSKEVVHRSSQDRFVRRRMELYSAERDDKTIRATECTVLSIAGLLEGLRFRCEKLTARLASLPVRLKPPAPS